MQSRHFNRKEWRIIHAATEAIGPKVCGIYRFTCKRTGRVYVGQAKDIALRVKQHANSAATSGPKSSAWHKALAVSGGVGSFRIEVLERLPLDRAVLAERENHWLKIHGAGTSLECFNTHPVSGLSPLGTSLPLVSILRTKQKLLGRPRPAWVKAKISATKLTPEGRARNSAANKGRKHTAEALASFRIAANRPEYIAKMRRIKKGTRPSDKALAASQSPEAIAKRVAKMKGRTVSHEMRLRISATMTGVKHTPERVRNQRLARQRFLATGKNPWIGRKHSEESKAKMRRSRLAYLSSKK